MTWDKLSDEERLHLYRFHPEDQRIPAGWRPKGCERKWDELTYNTQRNLYYRGSPRVPEGWVPIGVAPGSKAKKRVARKQGYPKGWHVGFYQHPETVVVPLTASMLELSEKDLWTVLESSWDHQEISPHTVTFEVHGKRLAPIKNVRFKEGSCV